MGMTSAQGQVLSLTLFPEPSLLLVGVGLFAILILRMAGQQCSQAALRQGLANTFEKTARPGNNR